MSPEFSAGLQVGKKPAPVPDTLEYVLSFIAPRGNMIKRSSVKNFLQNEPPRTLVDILLFQ